MNIEETQQQDLGNVVIKTENVDDYTMESAFLLQQNGRVDMKVKFSDYKPWMIDLPSSDLSLNSIENVKIHPETEVKTEVFQDDGMVTSTKLQTKNLTKNKGKMGKRTQTHVLNTDDCDTEDGSVSGQKSNTCDFCKKTFIKKSSLASHRVTHTGETPFKCEFCNKGFSVRGNLNVHMRIHTGQKPHECDICKKSFRQAGQLKQHMRIHKGEKPYMCSTCSRSFRNSSALVTHQRTHTGERPFPCDLCSRSFSTSTSLKTHRVTHSGTMLFDCPLCGRQFNRRNNLNVHIKRHNKNRSFSCPMCCNGFVMKAHLLGHLRRCHKVDIHADDFKYSYLLDTGNDVGGQSLDGVELDTGNDVGGQSLDGVDTHIKPKENEDN